MRTSVRGRGFHSLLLVVVPAVSNHTRGDSVFASNRTMSRVMAVYLPGKLI